MVKGERITREKGTLSPVIISNAMGGYRVVHPGRDGTYDDKQSYTLLWASPWHTLAGRLLAKGGAHVELVDDDEFVRKLLKDGTYRSPSDIEWYDPGDPIQCIDNAYNANALNTNAQIHIGMGLHYPDVDNEGMLWCRHTFLTCPPTGGIWEVTYPPWGYYGFPANKYWKGRWIDIAVAENRRGVMQHGWRRHRRPHKGS